MNKERMLELANFLDKLPDDKFYMGSWYYNPEDGKIVCEDDAMEQCGTTCCVAGWAVLHSGKCLDDSDLVRHKNRSYVRNIEGPVHAYQYAQKYLDLTDFQADSLFHSSGWREYIPYSNYEFWNNSKRTPKHAAQIIRKMVERENNG